MLQSAESLENLTSIQGRTYQQHQLVEVMSIFVLVSPLIFPFTCLFTVSGQSRTREARGSDMVRACLVDCHWDQCQKTVVPSLPQRSIAWPRSTSLLPDPQSNAWCSWESWAVFQPQEERKGQLNVLIDERQARLSSLALFLGSSILAFFSKLLKKTLNFLRVLGKEGMRTQWNQGKTLENQIQ